MIKARIFITVPSFCISNSKTKIIITIIGIKKRLNSQF